MACDAWCLLNNGTDRWLHSVPVYLNNTGYGQSILYCLLCMVSFKLLGITIFAMRLPAIIFSILTFIFGLKIVGLCYENNKLRMGLTAFLFLLVPYFTQNGRYAFDCNLMLGAFTVFFYCFLKAIKSQKYCYYVISGIVAGIVLYTYIVSYIVLPVFSFFSIVYLCWVKNKLERNRIVLYSFCFTGITLYDTRIKLK